MVNGASQRSEAPISRQISAAVLSGSFLEEVSDVRCKPLAAAAAIVRKNPQALIASISDWGPKIAITRFRL